MPQRTFQYSNKDIETWLDQSREVLRNTLRKMESQEVLLENERKEIYNDVSIVINVVTHLGQAMLQAARANPEDVPNLPFVQSPDIMESLQEIDLAVATVCERLDSPPVVLN